MVIRTVKSLALLSSGLLAGAMGYGAVNVAQTFKVVPLDVRLTFHAALMTMNGPVMQTAMGLTAVSTGALAVLSRGVSRLVAAGAAGLAVITFLVTRFGNVPINGRIKEWAVGQVPSDHLEILQRWDTFNLVRSSTAVTAFVAVIVIVTVLDRTRRVATDAPVAASA